MECIKRARKVDPSYDPEIVYLVVRKKIETRFFTENKGRSRGKFQEAKLFNPQPGTVIFEDLSRDNAYDFHLAAQKVTQGTTTPTQYVIAFNRSNVPLDALSRLTY